MKKKVLCTAMAVTILLTQTASAAPWQMRRNQLIFDSEMEKALAEFSEDKFKKIISKIEIDGKIIAFILVNGMEFTITKEEVL